MDDSKVFMFPDGGTRQTSNDVNSLLPRIEVVILMTMKNVITKEKNMGTVSVVVMDVINMKSAP